MKLVRDKIPLLMVLDGKQPKIRRAAKSERLDLLVSKLVEEVGELAATETISEMTEELVDVWEVLSALVGEFDSRGIDLVIERTMKADNKGAFVEFIILEENDLRLGETLRMHYAPVAGVSDWREISARDENRLLAIYDRAVERTDAVSAIDLYRNWLTVFAERVQPGERNIEDFEGIVNSLLEDEDQYLMPAASSTRS